MVIFPLSEDKTSDLGVINTLYSGNNNYKVYNVASFLSLASLSDITIINI
nr:MAG TPA: hypothetical protein [Caudoviricetes sp.]DAK59254.1 MAG TPA: hypothetical protein [Caudoviricetes sp.]